MKPRTFNSIFPALNHKWAARALGMEINPHNGPDLIDDNKIVECKFTLIDSKGIYPKAWTVLEYQLKYANVVKGYWGLGKYWLDRPISEIKTKNQGNLETMVLRREIYIVAWNWMHQYPAYRTKGKTKISEWNHVLRYPKLKDVPRSIRNHKVEKGMVHLTEGVSNEDFEILESKEKIPYL